MDSPGKTCNLLVQLFSACCLGILVLWSLKCPYRQHTLVLLRAKAQTCEGRAKLVGETSSRNILRCSLRQLNRPLAHTCAIWTSPFANSSWDSFRVTVSHGSMWCGQHPPATSLPSTGMSSSLSAGLNAWKFFPACFICYDNQSRQMQAWDPTHGTCILPIEGGQLCSQNPHIWGVLTTEIQILGL